MSPPIKKLGGTCPQYPPPCYAPVPGVSAPVAVTMQPAQVAQEVIRAEKVQKLAILYILSK